MKRNHYKTKVQLPSELITWWQYNTIVVTTEYSTSNRQKSRSKNEISKKLQILISFIYDVIVSFYESGASWLLSVSHKLQYKSSLEVKKKIDFFRKFVIYDVIIDHNESYDSSLESVRHKL